MATTLQLPNIRHFFKVMMPGFLTELWLPPKFCRRMINGEKWEKAVLKSGRGSWDVKVSRNSEGRLHLKEGWTAFVKHHKLCIGDFIVFEHKGDMVFHVLLFDKSGYENDYPLPVDAALNNHKRTGFQGQGNTHNHAKRFKGKFSEFKYQPELWLKT